MRTIAFLLSTSLMSVPARKVQVLVMAISVGTTAGIFVAVFNLAQSLTNTLFSGADPSRVIVMSKGAQWEGASYLPIETATRLSQSRCLASPSGTTTTFSPIALAAVTLFGPEESVVGMAIRGYDADWLGRSLTLVEGRWPQSGLHELAVGHLAAQAVPGAGIGNEILVNAHLWPVVGVFHSDTSLASVFVADANAMLDEYGRGGYNAAVGALAEDCDLEMLEDDLRTRDVDVDVVTEVKYAERVSEVLDTFRTLSLVVGVPMALGSVFGVFGVASTVVHNRRRELGMLLAMGFYPRAIATAVVVEFVFLAIICAAIATVAVFALMSNQLITFGVEVTSLTFEWQGGASTLGAALIFASATGLLGAFLPAFRISRMKIARILDRP